MARVSVRNAVPDPEVARTFDEAIEAALEAAEGAFTAWVKPAPSDAHAVTIHLEAPGKKETLGGVVQVWKRTIRLPLPASRQEVREAVARLLAT